MKHCPDIRPVFIFGASRSGTTMLASHLASNAEAIALPEMPFVQMIIKASPKNLDEITDLFQKTKATFHYRASGLAVTLDEFATPFLENWPPQERIFHLLRLHFNLSAEKTYYWIEHTPHNRVRVDLYRQVFPDAKFIHIVRDPRAVYTSMHNLWRWNTHNPIAFAYKWNEAITSAYLSFVENRDITIEVKYEDYLTNQKKELTTLCNFLELQFSENMLTGNGIKLPKYTQKQHHLVGKSVDVSRINAWKDSIPQREAELVSLKSYRWMLHYGYIANDVAIAPITLFESIMYKLKQIILTPIAKIKRTKDNISTK